MEEPEIVRALDAVRSFVAGSEPLTETLDHVARIAARALRADMAGLTLLYPDGKARTAVSTHPVATAVDDAQYAADGGPCMQAFRSRTWFKVDDTTTDSRWPEFAAAAAAHNVHSSLSTPLVVANEGIGALNLYSSEVGHFNDDDVHHAELYASQAAVVLANAQAYWEQAALAADLEKAMESRATIEQAKGIIMATAHVGPDDAFDLLRQQSQAENRKLRDIAAEIVSRQERNGESPG